jgi:hypothetical protein
MEVLTMANKELARKAMVLGNKLAPRMDGDRKAAFVEAWIIVKAGGLTLPVRGVSFGSRQEARRLTQYNPADVRAVLVPELSNPVDPAAVSVLHTLPAVQVTGDTVHGLRLHFAV